MPFFSVHLVDAYGRQMRKLIEVATQILLADYETIAGNYATALAAVTDLGLTKIDLLLSMDESFAVTAGANRDVGATFSGYTEPMTGKKASLKLPTIKAALVDPDGSVPIAGAVDTYLDLWLQSETPPLRLSDGETINAWIAGTLDK